MKKKFKRASKPSVPAHVWIRRLNNLCMRVKRGEQLDRRSVEKLIFLAFQLILLDDSLNPETWRKDQAIGAAKVFFKDFHFPRTRKKLWPFLFDELKGNSEITYCFHQTELPSKPTSKVLVIAFAGEPSYRFMEAIIAAGKSAMNPVALILDLRKLDTHWGDEMGKTIGEAGVIWSNVYMPIAVVTSALNRRGLTSLVKDELMSDPKTRLFTSIEKAVKFLDENGDFQRQPTFKRE